MHSFFSKILLFGEYSILRNSAALTVPFRHFSALLKIASEPLTHAQEKSNQRMREFLDYLMRKNFNWDLEKLYGDLQKGLVLESSIPTAYGLGSSGAVVAAVYHAYAKSNGPGRNLETLKQELALAESYFHGQSSGIDPLSILLAKPLVVQKGRVQLLADEMLAPALSNLYLLDTQTTGKTSGLVTHFKQLFDNAIFSRIFESEYLPEVNSIITDFTSGNNASISKRFKKISEFQLNHFSRMIPADFQRIGNIGIEEGGFALKLCGSGGGGYLLVHSELDQASLEQRLGYPLLKLNP